MCNPSSQVKTAETPRPGPAGQSLCCHWRHLQSPWAGWHQHRGSGSSGDGAASAGPELRCWDSLGRRRTMRMDTETWGICCRGVCFGAGGRGPQGTASPPGPPGRCSEPSCKRCNDFWLLRLPGQAADAPVPTWWPGAPGSPGPWGHPAEDSSSGSTFTMSSGLVPPAGRERGAGGEGRTGGCGWALGAPAECHHLPGGRGQYHRITESF